MVLAVAVAAMAVGEVALGRVGVWSTAIFGLSLFAFFLIQLHGSLRTWEPEEPSREGRSRQQQAGSAGRQRLERFSTGRLVLFTAVAGAVILAAGFLVARTADVIAEDTGLGGSFVGLLFVAIATSLPEVSTTVSAVRIGQYAMAFSNIFGANILDLSLLFLADLSFREGPALAGMGRFSLVACLLGILVTGVYLVGLLERRERTVIGLGVDSWIVLVLYFGGVFLLYQLRLEGKEQQVRAGS